MVTTSKNKAIKYFKFFTHRLQGIFILVIKLAITMKQILIPPVITRAAAAAPRSRSRKSAPGWCPAPGSTQDWGLSTRYLRDSLSLHIFSFPTSDSGWPSIRSSFLGLRSFHLSFVRQVEGQCVQSNTGWVWSCSILSRCQV